MELTAKQTADLLMKQGGAAVIFCEDKFLAYRCFVGQFVASVFGASSVHVFTSSSLSSATHRVEKTLVLKNLT